MNLPTTTRRKTTEEVIAHVRDYASVTLTLCDGEPLNGVINLANSDRRLALVYPTEIVSTLEDIRDSITVLLRELKL